MDMRVQLMLLVADGECFLDLGWRLVHGGLRGALERVFEQKRSACVSAGTTWRSICS